MRKSLPYALLAAAVLLWALCLPCLAAPQDYVFEVRSGGAPISGLATALTSSEAAYNATSEVSVSSGLPAVHEFGTSARYVVHYDAAANGPLVLTLDAGSTISDPNERYITLHLVADPALIASSSTGIAANSTAIAALPSAAQVVTALFGAAYLTVPGDHTTSGTQVVLTFKQWMALQDAIGAAGGDNTSTAPAKNGAATVTYYLRGAPKTSGNVVAVGTVNYDSLGNQTSRSVRVAQPFPPVN